MALRGLTPNYGTKLLIGNLPYSAASNFTQITLLHVTSHVTTVFPSPLKLSQLQMRGTRRHFSIKVINNYQKT